MKTEADIKWLDMPEIFRVNQLPAHSDHSFYSSKENYVRGNDSLRQSLNGTWRFQYSVNAMDRPVDFYKEDYNSSDFDHIAVPQHIEMAGYDKIHYTNCIYPWDGHTYRRPAHTLDGVDGDGLFSEASYNPVGSYLCHFDLKKELQGKRVHISFEGVEEAMYVWLNGVFIGYAEDSFTISEFDLTPYIRNSGNILAVEVHKRSTAAFLEDQDFFRFFGIFRDVNLYGIPDTHVEDLWIKPEYNVDNQTGEIHVDLTFSNKASECGQAKVTVYDHEDICLTMESKYDEGNEKICLTGKMPGKVTAWENENPYLYSVEIEIYGDDGELKEYIPYKIGFRKIEILNKVILFNGKRLLLNGVNRHEWSADGGRCITPREEELDIAIMKNNNINAVRTSHYPNHISWYYRCDESGLYVMAETNLETHGSWLKIGQREPSWQLPGSFPMWEEVVIDRARTNFEMFKNHVSILFWSLGNESMAGDNIRKMNDYFKTADPGRLVHYEGVFNDPDYRSTVSDVESRMYETPAGIREYLENDPAKPFLLCEYMHSMGNSVGGMKSYMDLEDEFEMFSGGFIWDFVDQALWIHDEVSGKKVLKYGGDFDDKPSDYEFSGDGILFADRTEKPAMQEVKYYYGRNKQ